MAYSNKNITASINRHFNANFTTLDGDAIGYGTEPRDWEKLSEFVLFDAQVIGKPSYRNGGNRIDNIRVIVHCFSKHVDSTGSRANIYSHLILSDAVETAMNHSQVVVNDYDTGGNPAVGTVKFKEARTQDVSSGTNESNRGGLYHARVIIDAIAQED